MFISIRLYMNPHHRLYVGLEINHAEGSGVRPPSAEAANQAASNSHQ